MAKIVRVLGLAAVWSFACWPYSTANAQTAGGCRTEIFEQAPFTICTYDGRVDSLFLALRDTHGKLLRSFTHLSDTLGQSRSTVVFAMNAGMFEKDGTPIGLFIEHGRTVIPPNDRNGDGNFYMKPNGVFSVDRQGTPRVQTLAAYLSQSTDPVWATQSGPMLLIDGALHPKISKDGPSKYVRNGVGITDDHTAIFAISETAISFGLLARLFRDRLHCHDALYLDGAISSIWVPTTGRRDDAYPLGPLVVVTH